MTPQEQDLILQIEKAFFGVRLEDGVSLNMTEYYDSHESTPKYAEEAKGDERDDWRKIGDETLEEFTVTFCFTDLNGYRFYIPAYMRWSVRNHSSSDAIISDNTIYAIDPQRHQFKEVSFLDWFTELQVAAMTRYLEYSIEHADTMDATVARTNLNRIRIAQQASALNAR